MALQALQNQRREEQHIQVSFHDRPSGAPAPDSTPQTPAEVAPPAPDPDPGPGGPVQTGPVQTGPVQTGPVQTGPAQTGPALGDAQQGDVARAGDQR
jgi:hypothetical protein